ncbi:MAG: hybrid sensor histidine kinase/response regulator [Chloroflexi bacterium]|nr:hybrid sensor histidine kinase/response regulator [Chloroflexota bacterium]
MAPENEPGPRLLLVDDDAAVRMTLAAVLTKEGYDVTAVGTGAEALVALHQGQFDVVLSDLRLDDIDGLAVLSRAQELNPDAVTVVLTGYATIDSVIDAIRRGVFGYVVKPCKIDEMNATIRSGLDRKRMDRADKQVAIAGAVAEARLRAMRDFEIEKGTWLAAISHDLKGPLTTIKGTVQWLRGKRRFEDEQRLLQAFETIDLTASRMARMVDELADISRTDDDRRRLNLEVHDLAALVRRIVAEHQPTTDRHTIEVDCRCDGLTILCDGPQLERVVGNLLSNAVKYSPAAGTISVTLDRDADGENAVAVLQVTDHGVGIPADELDKVFTRFYRGTNVSRRIPGTGIGLTGSRQILEDHGATISVESVEGKGSTFTVRLPLAAVPAASSQPATTPV